MSHYWVFYSGRLAVVTVTSAPEHIEPQLQELAETYPSAIYFIQED